VIVGTGHHYILDAIVGALAVGFGFAAAGYLHRTRPAFGATAAKSVWQVVCLAGGYAMMVDWVDGVSATRIPLDSPSPITFVPLIAIGAILVAVSRPRLAIGAPGCEEA
jgi:hypothetical protein